MFVYSYCYVLCILFYLLCCVLFVCKCVLYYWHRVLTQFQLTNISYIYEQSQRARSVTPLFAQMCRRS
jgi:hypothetical protein